MSQLVEMSHDKVTLCCMNLPNKIKCNQHSLDWRGKLNNKSVTNVTKWHKISQNVTSQIHTMLDVGGGSETCKDQIHIAQNPQQTYKKKVKHFWKKNISKFILDQGCTFFLVRGPFKIFLALRATLL
jgi:hypothetical protein